MKGAFISILVLVLVCDAAAQVKPATATKSKPATVAASASNKFVNQLVPCGCIEKVNDKKVYGYCDTLTMALALPCHYDSAYSFSQGLARVIINGKVGYIDKTGKVVIAAVYDEGEDFSDGFAYVKKGNNYFYINKVGANQFKKNFPLPATQKVEGLSEAAQRMVNENIARQKKLLKFSDGLALFLDSSSKKFGYIDTKGIATIPPKFAAAFPFSEGIAFVKESQVSATRAIDKKGSLLFELPENMIPAPEGFRNGFAVVTMRPSQGVYKLFYNLVDKTGKKLLAENAVEIKPFKNGYAVVKYENGYPVIIDQKGEKLLKEEIKYVGVTDIKDIFFYSNNTEKGFGLMDKNGRRITAAEFVNFKKLNDTVFACQPWGSSVHTLLSVHSGELIHSSFSRSAWVKGNQNPVFRLYGGIMREDDYLEYDPFAGKFMKDGKELLAKDNYYLKTEPKKEVKKGEIKFENKYFSLTFPEEMEIFKKDEKSTVYNHSTFYFGISNLSYYLSADEYIDRMRKNLASSNEYETLEVKGTSVGGKYLKYLEATKKKETGSGTKTRAIYMPFDNTVIHYDKTEMHTIISTYFVSDEKIDGPFLMKILSSVKFK